MLYRPTVFRKRSSSFHAQLNINPRPFFLLVDYSRFYCEVLSRLSFFCLGMILLLIYWTSVVTHEILHKRFFLIHGRHLSGRLQCSHRATSATWTTMSSGNPHLSSVIRDICRAVSNVVTGHIRRDQSRDQATPSKSYCMSSHYTAICWET